MLKKLRSLIVVISSIFTMIKKLVWTLPLYERGTAFATGQPAEWIKIKKLTIGHFYFPDGFAGYKDTWKRGRDCISIDSSSM